MRKRALRLYAGPGAEFSGLTASWASFLVAAASLLKPGGRMAFVVPAAIGHAPYAAPLLDYLVGHFTARRPARTPCTASICATGKPCAASSGAGRRPSSA